MKADEGEILLVSGFISLTVLKCLLFEELPFECSLKYDGADWKPKTTPEADHVEQEKFDGMH